MDSEDGFLLMTAEEFGRYLAGLQVARSVVRIQNHHTWIPAYEHFKNGNHFSLLRSMRRSHMQDRGWSNIGQNLTTFNDGKVAVCRPLADIPAAIKGANTGSIAIEHVGNFDVGCDTEKDEYRAHQGTIISVNALLCKRFNLVPSIETVVYHHWYDLNTGKRTNGTGITKSCPGTNFFTGNSVEAAQREFIPKIQAEIARLGTAPLPQPQLPLGEGVVEAAALNVRDLPGKSGRVMKQLQRGARVLWYARSASYGASAWLRIDPSREEWVSAPYIKAAP